MISLEERVAGRRAAVVVVDVQNDFCQPDGALGQRGEDTSAALAMLPTLRRLLDAARAHRTPIVFVQTIHEDATDSAVWRARSGAPSAAICRKGSWGAGWCGLEPLPDEPIVVKHRYDAFLNTRLESVLHTLGIETLIVTGVQTNVCVESTVRHGFMLDYHIVLVSDGCATYDADEHQGTLTNVRLHFGVVATVDDVVAAWQAAPLAAR